MPIADRAMKPLTISLNGIGRGSTGRDGGGNLTNVCNVCLLGIVKIYPPCTISTL
jgi:hypothetical protein